MTEEIKYNKDEKWIPYKQLAETPQQTITRLEQERDELKKACEKCKLFDIEKTNRDLHEQIEKLEQENKELKEKLDKEEYNACCECTNIQNQNDEYRSALEEIKEIANKFDYWNSNLPEASNVINEIKEKINEVLQCE